MSDLDAALNSYIAFFEGLTPERLDELDRICTPDVRFADPFNDLRGVAGMRAVLRRMYADVEAPSFRVTRKMRDGEVAYLRWVFTCRPHGSAKDLRIEGVSEVTFDEAGRVAAHIDFWDAAGQLYERLPVLGWILRQVRRRLSVSEGE